MISHSMPVKVLSSTITKLLFFLMSPSALRHKSVLHFCVFCWQNSLRLFTSHFWLIRWTYKHILISCNSVWAVHSLTENDYCNFFVQFFFVFHLEWDLWVWTSFEQKGTIFPKEGGKTFCNSFTFDTRSAFVSILYVFIVLGPLFIPLCSVFGVYFWYVSRWAWQRISLCLP